MTQREPLHRHTDRGLLPISKPSKYMEESGVHPHISHEHDIPAMVAKMVAEVDRLGREVARYYDADKNTTWREHAKALATRVSNQRKEIHRLHRKVRDLRADVHFAQEQANEADEARSAEVSAERERAQRLERYFGVIAEGCARMTPLLRNAEYTEAEKAADWLRQMCKEATDA